MSPHHRPYPFETDGGDDDDEDEEKGRKRREIAHFRTSLPDAGSLKSSP